MTSLLYNLIIAENYINSSNKESFSECYEVIKYTSVVIISIIKLYWSLMTVFGYLIILKEGSLLP